MKAVPLDLFNCPLDGISLIEASAGTGKTWNICGLYMRLLLERGLQVQQILVVTFTNAATAELRERIRSRIAETLARLRSGPASPDPFVDSLLDSLRQQHQLEDLAMERLLDLALQTFDEASIFTIHGFCQRALGDTPFTAGMPMTLELLSDDSDLRLEIVHDFWRCHIAGGKLPPALASHLMKGRNSPEYYAELLKRQQSKPMSRVIWPQEIEQQLGDIAELSAAHADAQACWLQQRSEILACVTEALPRLNGKSYTAESIAKAAANWDQALISSDALAATELEKLDLFSRTKLKPNKGKAEVQSHVFFDLAERWLALREATDSGLAMARMRLLRDLLTKAPAALRQAKRERRVIAFDDMLFNLHQRLGSSPWLAEALRARFPAALIDEFQDTDPLQFAIFDRIYGGAANPLFLVGDPKQAIYSFRNADLPTYLKARNNATAQYTLSQNQRSTQPLLDALNNLFSGNPNAFMQAGLGFQPVGYGNKQRKTLHDETSALQPRSALQLWTLPCDEDDLPLPKKLALLASARACAGEISRLIGAAQQGQINLAAKPLAAGDIAVLVRSHSQGSQMRRALADLNIASVELSQAGIYASPDAEEMTRLLAAILEPTREGLLRAALSTDLMGQDAAAILSISADEASLLEWVTRFVGYRETWLQRGIGVMLRRLMNQEAVSERLLGRPDGERRLTNLLHLSECLHEAGAQQAGPEALLRWLQAQRKLDSRDDATQLRLESDRNLVQVITIHRAKGLEYPVVFCPFLWDGHPGGSASGPEGREYHEEDLPVIDMRQRDAIEKAEDAVITGQISLSRAAENLRLIYVALTRAVQRCYLVVGSYSGRAGKDGKPGSTGESNRSLLNWLVAGQGHDAQEWLNNKKLEPQQIAAAWQAFAEANQPQVNLAMLPQLAPNPFQPLGPAAETLAALAAPAHIPGGWRIGSYSSLAHGASHEGAAVDHDLHVAEVAPSEAGVTAVKTEREDDDILDFPRGPVAGECLHDVFERIDFSDPTGWPDAIAAALRSRPQKLAGADSEALRLPRMIQRMLTELLQTRLPAGFALAEVKRGRRLVELEFSLPARRLTAARLTALLQRHGVNAPALAFGSLDGYLRGFIDLLYEHGGRFYVLDWKSNHLGDSQADYGQASMAKAMDEHNYHLQYLLYTVAVHRYLQQRIAGYQYEQHFGGVQYLFVRGVRPEWIDAEGRACGIFAARPTLQFIEQLSSLIGAHEVSA